MSCCGGHSSGDHKGPHNRSTKLTIWKWLVGVAVLAGFIYWLN